MVKFSGYPLPDYLPPALHRLGTLLKRALAEYAVAPAFGVIVTTDPLVQVSVVVTPNPPVHPCVGANTDHAWRANIARKNGRRGGRPPKFLTQARAMADETPSPDAARFRVLAETDPVHAELYRKAAAYLETKGE